MTEKWKKGELNYNPQNGKKFTRYEARTNYYRKLAEEDQNELVDFSDMLQGATNGDMELMTGHEYGYWKKSRSRLGNEAFAEMTSATMSNPTSLKGIKRHLPKSYEIYEEIIRTKGVSNNGYID